MNIVRLMPLTAVLVAAAAPFASAQLPPSLVQPGRPAVPGIPVLPNVPVTPTAPATPVAEAPAALPGSGAPNSLTAEEIAQGWKLLFDGRRLFGMRGLQKADPFAAGWKIKDGELNLPKDTKDMERMTGGDIITQDFFFDFDFRFEWKMPTGTDSGVRYMLTENFGQVPVGLEYQILDELHSSLKLKENRTRHTGALDRILPVGENAKLRLADPLNKTGDPWNEGRIVVQGTHIEHWLNGNKVLEFELGPKLRQLAVANKMQVPASFGMKSRTRISICDQGYEIAFRNLKVLTLAPQAVVIPGGVRPGGSKVPNPLLLPRGK